MDRKGFIGASDAYRIMKGEWLQLYLEKTGQAQPEDLSSVFRVQLGTYTEPFHFGWLNKCQGFELTTPENRYHDAARPHMTALLDAWCTKNNLPVELKHGNSYTSMEEYAETYLPQIAHQCHVLGVPACILSVIRGNNDPEQVKVEPPQLYIDELVEHEDRFWWHVTNAVAPEIIPKAALVKTAGRGKDVRLDDMRTVDMATSNEWGSLAVDYLAHEDNAATFEKAKKGLKELVAADVREAKGHGIIIKRSANGSLLFSKEKKP